MKHFFNSTSEQALNLHLPICFLSLKLNLYQQRSQGHFLLDMV